MTFGELAHDQRGRCTSCGHDFAPHTVAAVVFGADIERDSEIEPPIPDDAPLGGWVFCQQPDCSCHFTWSVKWPSFDEQAVVDLIPTWEVFVLDYRDRQSMS